MAKTAVFILAALVLSSCSKRSPQQQAEMAQSAAKYPTVPIPEFSGKAAFAYLVKQVDFGPRNPGSSGHHQCLLYLQHEFSLYADTVQLENFNVPGYDGVVLHLTNIIASFNMKATKRVLLSAHWDTRPRADHQPGGAVDKPIPGADDGASGVAVLLELAKDFKESPPPVGVDIMLWDGEDYGREGDLDYYCLGSKYWAATKPYSYQPDFAVNLDMIGQKDLKLEKEGYSVEYAPDVVNLIWNTAKEMGVPQFVDTVGDTIYDDQVPLQNVGINAIDIIDFNYKYWHTLEDTPDKCSPESLSAVGSVLLRVLYRKISIGTNE